MKVLRAIFILSFFIFNAQFLIGQNQLEKVNQLEEQNAMMKVMLEQIQAQLNNR